MAVAVQDSTVEPDFWNIIWKDNLLRMPLPHGGTSIAQADVIDA